MKDTKKLLLLDTFNLIFRAYYGARNLDNGALMSLTRTIKSLMKKFNPDYIVATLDDKAPNFRHELLPSYKGHRPEVPEDLIDQIKKMPSLFDALNMAYVRQPGAEADDLIASYAKKAAAEGVHVIIVSSDKDLQQLIDDEHGIKIWNPGKSIEIDETKFQEIWGFDTTRMHDFLSISGDSADGIAGVKGIGEKGAKELIKLFANLEDIFAAVEIERPFSDKDKKKRAIFPPRTLKKLEAENAYEDAMLAQKLVALQMDLDLTYSFEDLAEKQPSMIRAVPLLREWGIRRLVEDIEKEFAAPIAQAVIDDGQVSFFDVQPETKIDTRRPVPKTYHLITNTDEWNHIKTQFSDLKFPLAIDTETTGLNPHEAQLVGISLSWGPEQACYIPIAHKEGDNAPWDDVLAWFKDLIKDGLLFVAHNAKYDLHILRHAGLNLPCAGDSLILSQMIHPLLPSHSLDNLARHFLGHQCVAFSEVVAKGQTFADVPLDMALHYAAEDADICLQLYQIFIQQIQGKLKDLYQKTELPLIAVLQDMEFQGILLDTNILLQMSDQWGQTLDKLELEIRNMAQSPDLNINSPKQLGIILFEKLGYPVIKRTGKTKSYSTSEAVLSELADKGYPLASLLMEYRQLSKLRSTYAEALPKLIIEKTGRIHTHYNQTGVATGRLSSDHPNLQNIPIKTENGRLIRKAFVPAEGKALVIADYSQIELRLLAHFSEDPLLIKAFNDGQDIHRSTAAALFEVNLEQVSTDQRRQAKAVNFGLIYGMGPQRLSREWNMSMSDAKDFIAKYFAAMPKVKDYFEDLIDETRRRGGVGTLGGRFRPLPDILSGNTNLRLAAERMAQNTPLQGSAADLIKMAMINLHSVLEQLPYYAKMLLQVHDELVLEVDEAHVEEVKNILTKQMEEVMTLKIPLVVDAAIGHNWLDAKA